MFRRSVLALASLAFLIPGNLLAVALQAGADDCAAHACCCEPVAPQEHPAFVRACCCEVQPAPAPDERPTEPLQAADTLPVAAAPALAAEIPGAAPVAVRCRPRPAFLAPSPPGPLFLRLSTLRL